MTDWMSEALCATHPEPDLWFADKPGVAGQLQILKAQRICERCPVQVQCGIHRKKVGATAGVWGGDAVKETTGASSGGPQHSGALHGTPSGYTRHYQRGEKPCQACWSAHSRSGSPNGRSRSTGFGGR